MNNTHPIMNSNLTLKHSAHTPCVVGGGSEKTVVAYKSMRPLAASLRALVSHTSRSISSLSDRVRRYCPNHECCRASPRAQRCSGSSWHSPQISSRAPPAPGVVGEVRGGRP